MSRSPKSFAHNLSQAALHLRSWPVGVGSAVVTGVLVYGWFANDYGLSGIEKAAAHLSAIAAVCFLKLSFDFAFYPILYRRRFEGSYLWIALIATTLIFAATGLLYAVVSDRFGDPFGAEFIPVLCLAFVMNWLFVLAAFRLFSTVYDHLAESPRL